MKSRILCIATLFSALLLSNGAAEGPADGSQERQLSEAANNMVAAQLAHIKLWFAGKLGNWKLATYELERIQSELDRSAGLYPDKALMVSADEPLQAVQKAIGARDAASFAKAYADLTNACNACHRAVNRSFIAVQVPVNSPFSDQVFVDQVAEGRALAHAVCAECHMVSPDSKELPAYRIPTPSFPDIARRSSFSDAGLRQYLSSGHRKLGPNQAMPNPRLNEYQIEEIVAYFEALKSGQ
jgi:mono/diheme cytochrome c family protein